MLFKEFTAILNPHSRRMVIGICLNAIGNGMSMSLLLVYFHDIRGFTNAFGGLLLAAEALVGIAVSGPIGAAIDRFGPKRMMIGGLLAAAGSAASFSLITEHWHAVVVVTIFAVGGQCVWPSQMVILTRVTPEEHRQKIFGFQFMVLNLGIGFGGLLSSLIIREGSLTSFQIMYWCDSATYLLYLVIILGLKTPHAERYVTKEHEPEQGSYKDLFAIKELTLLTVAGVVLLTFGYGGIQSGIPIFATQYLDLSPQWLGIIFGVNTFSIVLLQPVVLRMLERFNKYTALVSVGVIWALSWVFVGVAPFLPLIASGLALCVSQFVFAFGEMVHAPTNPALIQELTPENIRGRSSSLMSLQWGISGVIGPAIAGSMIGSGLETQWVLVMLLGSLAPVPLFMQIRRHQIRTRS